MKIYIVYDIDSYTSDIHLIRSVWSSKKLAEQYVAKFGSNRYVIDDYELDQGSEILDNDLFYYEVEMRLHGDAIKIHTILKRSGISHKSHTTNIDGVNGFECVVAAKNSDHAKIKALELYEQYRIKNQ